MKRIILKSQKSTIDINKINFDTDIVATKVLDSAQDDNLFFLCGNKISGCGFTNLRNGTLGGFSPIDKIDAIKARIQGTDCNCNSTEVYVFESIKEAIEELGE